MFRFVRGHLWLFLCGDRSRDRMKGGLMVNNWWFLLFFFLFFFYYYLLHWLKREEKGKTVLLCPIDQFRFLKRRNLSAGSAAWKENWEKYRETCSSSWSASPVDHKSQIYYSVPIIVFKLYNMTCGQTNDIKFESFYKSHCRYITV